LPTQQGLLRAAREKLISFGIPKIYLIL